jgi:hypothetical protein
MALNASSATVSLALMAILISSMIWADKLISLFLKNLFEIYFLN